MRALGISPAFIWAGAVAVAVLVTARVVVALRRRRVGAPLEGAKRVPLPMLCTSCRRAFPAGITFCPVDATRLTAVVEGALAQPGRGGRCPRCRRSFEAGVRFCPMDGEELVPLQLWQATHPEGGVSVEPSSDHLIGGDGKICPVCAARYDLAAGFCGRDAAELVTIN